MMASHTFNIFVGTTLLSAIFAFIYWIQEQLNVEHRQRLLFLKANIVVTWLVMIISVLIFVLNASYAIGQLIPNGEVLNRAIAGSKARVLIFEHDNSSLSKVILGIYLLGLLILIVRFLFSYLQMRKLLLDSSVIQINDRNVRVADLATSPFSFGFMNPQIFIPSQFLNKRLSTDRFTEAISEEKSKEMSEEIYKKIYEKIEVVLVHEETHIKNRDPQWKLISRLTKFILYFNPIAFYLDRKLELEMEIECDRLTVKKTNLPTSIYGNLLIDTVVNLQNNRTNPMFTYMSHTNLKGRIQAMTAKTLHRPILATIFGTIVLTVSAVSIAISTGVSKYKEQYKVSAEIIFNGKVISTPQFIVLANEPAVLEMKTENPKTSLRMELTAADFASANTTDGIDLKMTLEYKTLAKSFRSNPRVIVAPGEVGTITMGSDANDILEMKITAERE